MAKKLFSKDLTLVIIGQIISLFGNAALRFALPLFILDETGSPALFGLVSATAFIPMILLSPVGGIIADRVNKQRIMVALDFATAALMGVFLLMLGRVELVPLIVGVLMLLYGIQGAYSPAVQASLPLLVGEDKLIAANAATNLVSSLSGMLGPVLGGLLYARFGLLPVVQVSALCFFASAILELFILIPHKRQPSSGGVLKTVKADLSTSLHFILRENPVMLRVLLIVVAFNLFLSSMLVIGLPVIITQTLSLGADFMGYAEGALGLGGLAGGILAGILGQKIGVSRAWWLLLLCAACMLPMGLALLFGLAPLPTFALIACTGFIMMLGATLFSILMMAFVQAITPTAITGKVISCVMALSMCAQPVGQALYGFLFEQFSSNAWIILLLCTAIAAGIALYSRRIFSALENTGAAPAATESADDIPFSLPVLPEE